MKPAQPNVATKWEGLFSPAGVIAIAMSIMILFMAHYFFRDDTVDVTDINASEGRVSPECKPLFSSMIQYEVLTKGKPLEEEDLEKIEKRLGSIQPKNCEHMVKQITRSQ